MLLFWLQDLLANLKSSLLRFVNQHYDGIIYLVFFGMLLVLLIAAIILQNRQDKIHRRHPNPPRRGNGTPPKKIGRHSLRRKQMARMKINRRLRSQVESLEEQLQSTVDELDNLTKHIQTRSSVASIVRSIVAALKSMENVSAAVSQQSERSQKQQQSPHTDKRTAAITSDKSVQTCRQTLAPIGDQACPHDKCVTVAETPKRDPEVQNCEQTPAPLYDQESPNNRGISAEEGQENDKIVQGGLSQPPHRMFPRLIQKYASSQDSPESLKRDIARRLRAEEDRLKADKVSKDLMMLKMSMTRMRAPETAIAEGAGQVVLFQMVGDLYDLLYQQDLPKYDVPFAEDRAASQSS